MRFSPRLRSVLLAGSIALFGTALPAAAQIYIESGDAGDLPGTAQTTSGAGALEAITGTIASGSDQDMFLIFINDPGSFSASTNNVGTALSGDSDTQLFLFDANGFGIVANDDADSSTFTSTIPVGSLSSLSAGNYYLAVAIFDNDPISSGGEIFPDAEGVLSPTGPGGGSPISGWNNAPDPVQTGPYRINLTGATAAAAVVAPEPATLALFAAGLLPVAGAVVRKRRKH